MQNTGGAQSSTQSCQKGTFVQHIILKHSSVEHKEKILNHALEKNQWKVNSKNNKMQPWALA